MCPSRAGNERVRRVDRSPPSVELGLVAAGPHGSFPTGLEEVKPVQQGADCLPFLRSDASLDFGDVDAARSERMPVGEQTQEERFDDRITAQMGDENGRVEKVQGQEARSVRRVLRTHAAAERRSRQWR